MDGFSQERRDALEKFTHYGFGLLLVPQTMRNILETLEGALEAGDDSTADLQELQAQILASDSYTTINAKEMLVLPDPAQVVDFIFGIIGGIFSAIGDAIKNSSALNQLKQMILHYGEEAWKYVKQMIDGLMSPEEFLKLLGNKAKQILLTLWERAKAFLYLLTPAFIKERLEKLGIQDLGDVVDVIHRVFELSEIGDQSGLRKPDEVLKQEDLIFKQKGKRKGRGG